MKKAVLPSHPKEVMQKILRSLPNRRLRDVIERRYGLTFGQEETLEAIGKNYGITRERVRQIEADALKRLKRPETLLPANPVFVTLAKHIDEHGGVAAERALLGSVAENKFHPHLKLLLALCSDLNSKREDDHHYDRWYTKPEALEFAEAALKKTVDGLASVKKLVSGDHLSMMLRENIRSVVGQAPTTDVIDSFLGISKIIRKNPYGEFGLVEWPEISPSGVRDKAYVALVRNGSPLHFTEVAKVIDKAKWGLKKTHPQTVHNELIKDDRFVLVGRGLYALKEWGYEAGTVADVITSILKSSKNFLDKSEIVKRVLEKRTVKENTILLNLQNKKRFKRVESGYTLV